jgi:hypothetical protein
MRFTRGRKKGDIATFTFRIQFKRPCSDDRVQSQARQLRPSCSTNCSVRRQKNDLSWGSKDLFLCSSLQLIYQVLDETIAPRPSSDQTICRVGSVPL